MKIEFTEAEKRAIVLSLFTDNDIYIHGLEFKYSEHLYKQATIENPDLYHEDYILRALELGSVLVLHDTEGGVNDSSLFLREIYAKLDIDTEGKKEDDTYSQFVRNVLQIHNEDYDVENTDSVIQYLFYREFVFG